MFFAGLIVLLLFLTGTIAVLYNILMTLKMQTRKTIEIAKELSIIAYSWKANLIDCGERYKRIAPIGDFLLKAFYAFLGTIILMLCMILCMTLTGFDFDSLIPYRNCIFVFLLIIASLVVSAFGYTVIETSKI